LQKNARMASSPSTSPAVKEVPLLVVVPSVGVARDERNRLIIDEKAISGLHLYQKLWPGRVRCIFREGDRSAVIFGRTYDLGRLPFEIEILPRNALVPDSLISDASIVLASGDNWLDLPIADQSARLDVPVCFVIEYILETRLQILALSEMPLFSKAKSFVWNLMIEGERRRAFSRSVGLQSNGTPAAWSYRHSTPNVMTFFDTRLSEHKMATEREISAKQLRIMKGSPLRLAFTGRLEKWKGADDLIDIAAMLDQKGKEFVLDIYGSGSLAPEMSSTLSEAPETLRRKIRIHEPLDFNRELVPLLRSEVDLFLCCHRQSDPSCTYLETLGCGVPILGYGNRALRGILGQADIGWITPPNAKFEIVRTILELDANRFELANKMRNALNFASKHSFEGSFQRRIDQLWQLSHQQSTLAPAKDAAER
jgi:colanic acid/amylovoran biosynthesis glycosyltransferase